MTLALVALAVLGAFSWGVVVGVVVERRAWREHFDGRFPVVTSGPTVIHPLPRAKAS